MPYNEDQIRETLKQQSVDMDTNLFWDSVRQHAPVKKEKKWIPLFWMFFAGFLVSGCLVYFTNKPEDSGALRACTQTTDSLMIKNQMLQQNLVDMTKKYQDLLAVNQQKTDVVYNRPANHFNTFNHNTNRNQTNISETIPATLSFSKNDYSAQVLPTELPETVKMSDIENKEVTTTTKTEKTDIVQEKSDASTNGIQSIQSINHTSKNIEYFVGLSSGLTWLTDQKIFDEGSSTTKRYIPGISYTSDVGIFKNINRKLDFGLFLHYSNMVAALKISERTIEHITITDTTEITLGPNGISNVTIGNNGAVVITEQSGKLYANHQRFSILPVLSHHTLTHKKWQWHNLLGIGFDIWNISRNIVSGDQAHQHLIHKDQNLSFRPLLRVGSQIRYTLRKDVQAALLLQCMYRRENYNYSLYHGFRSSIFPSIGLGLFFK